MLRTDRLGRHPCRLLSIGLIAIGIGTGKLWYAVRIDAALMSRGINAYSRHDWAGAAAMARQRLKAAPDDGEAARLLARVTARQDRDQQAIAIYSRLDLKLMTAEDYFLLGRALSRTGQDDSALNALKTARDADPNRPETLDALAELLFRKDLHAAAEETALRLSQQPGWEARGHLMLGLFRSVLQDPAGAAQALRRAFELDPTGMAAAPAPVAQFQKLLVRSLLRIKDPALARSYFEAIPVSERGPEGAWLLSRCFLQERDGKNAAAALQDAGSYRDAFPLELEPAPYVGAARCGTCHSAQFKSVVASRHATTFSLARQPTSVPLPGRSVPDPGDPSVAHTLERRNDGIDVQSRVGGQLFRALARYAFGSPDHFVTMVGTDDKGKSRMVRMSYYRSPRGSGWDLSSGMELHPAHPDEFLGRVLDARDGERRCLSCHTTNFRAIEDQTGPESADLSIGCEACHGPGGNHVIAAETQFVDSAIISPGRESGNVINQVCARCHGLTHAEAFAGPDDDPGWLRFQNITLARSRCYTAGGGKLNCVTCHDPHANADTRAARNEAKCLSCHSPGLGGNRPCPVNASRGCIECHMPKIWVQATHSLKSDHNIRVHKRRAGEK